MPRNADSIGHGATIPPARRCASRSRSQLFAREVYSVLVLALLFWVTGPAPYHSHADGQSQTASCALCVVAETAAEDGADTPIAPAPKEDAPEPEQSAGPACSSCGVVRTARARAPPL